MNTLQTLREKNPNLPFYSVYDAEFARFGRVVPFDVSALTAACEKAAVMPDSGVRYVPVLPELEALPAFEDVQRTLRGEAPCELGCCWGHSSALNCLEYHRSSEHNIAVSDLVVLLAAQQDMEGFDMPAGKIAGFFVPKGTTVELYATTLHYAPCQTTDEGFRDIIVLPRGTNEPLSGPRPEGGDGRLLWARDKWLVAHPDSRAEVAAGAYPGLHGENFVVRY
jgi:hypothetical protein